VARRFSVVQGSTGVGKGIAVSGTGFYFATTSGLWVSTTSGAAGSFTLKGTADGLGSSFLLDVAVDGSGKVLVATDSGLSVSANSGASFTNVTVPATPRGIYAQGSTWYAPTSRALAISTNAGASWSPTTVPGRPRPRTTSGSAPDAHHASTHLEELTPLRRAFGPVDHDVLGAGHSAWSTSVSINRRHAANPDRAT